MVTSELEKIDSAAIARSEEIHKLSRFLSPYQGTRTFVKKIPEALLCASPPDTTSKDSPPASSVFLHLRDEFGLLLGVAGSNLVLKTWDSHHLSLSETDPQKLQPALIKLFSTAARIAAPRGNSQGLKSVLRGFESQFFDISAAAKHQGPLEAHNHRFSLLAMIQRGSGAKLLQAYRLTKSTVIGSVQQKPEAESEPSQAERTRLRREFLFESSCRAKSWVEAYRQCRLLSYGHPRPRLSMNTERRMAEVYRMNLGQAVPGSKKKQLLADIARLPADYDEQPEEFALRAVSAVAVSCRPGDDEALVCQMLPPSDPRWRICIRRLYRHQPVSETWLATLRKLWQQEPTVRSYYRGLFTLLRFSRRRAESAQAGLPPIQDAEHLEPCQLQARMARSRGEVQVWNSLLADPVGSDDPNGGTVIKVRRSLWDHICKVSHELGLVAPQRASVVPRFDDVGVRTVPGGIELVVSPVMLSTREGEARFLVARALYRHAVGLDAIERRGLPLCNIDAVAERAIAYTEWKGFSLEPMSVIAGEQADLGELQVALEELFWQTGDRVYANLCEVLANRCWCPRADLEADLFARRYCHMIDATYGILASGFACLPLYRDCESRGLGRLMPRLKDYPGLVLRLQNLWMSGAEEVQKRLTR